MLEEDKIKLIEDIVLLSISLKPHQTEEDSFAKIGSLKNLYSIELNSKLSILKGNREAINKILTPSIFELFDHNFRENTHSNVLSYILDSNHFDFAKQIIIDFLSYDSPTELFLKELVSTDYKIYREFSIDGGRIDLLIENVNSKQIVVIENKILADIGKNKMTEQDGVNQLQFYYNYIEKNYPKHKKLYYILSYRTSIETENTPMFYPLNYNKLFEIIRGIRSDNNVMIEYKKLLRNLLFPIEKASNIKSAFLKNSIGIKDGLTVNYANLLINILNENTD